MPIPWLGRRDPFPPVEEALDEPNGLLAAGGDLSPERLIDAYTRGIFPWFNDEDPVLWWSPDPRMVLFPRELHVSRSLRRVIRSGQFAVTLDRAFTDVVEGCAAPRANQDGTWITDDMALAYSRLAELGYAHSVEVWEGEALVGGLYGVAVGRVFYGESMFSRTNNASKVANAGSSYSSTVRWRRVTWPRSARARFRARNFCAACAWGRPNRAFRRRGRSTPI